MPLLSIDSIERLAANASRYLSEQLPRFVESRLCAEVFMGGILTRLHAAHQRIQSDSEICRRRPAQISSIVLDNISEPSEQPVEVARVLVTCRRRLYRET